MPKTMPTEIRLRRTKCYCGRELKLYPLGVAVCELCDKVSPDCDCEKVQ